MAERKVARSYPRAARTLGEKVRAMREHRTMTQEDLASKTGLSRNQIQNIEHNRNNSRGADGRPGPGNARLDTVFMLAQVLDVDVTYLVDPDVPVLPLPE